MEQIANIINMRPKILPMASFDGLHSRSKNKKTRLYLDNELIPYIPIIGHSGLAIYCVLAKYANYKSQECWPSINTIMKEAGIKNKNTAHKKLRLLEKYNIIAIISSRGRSSNRYLLIDSSDWIQPNGITNDTVQNNRTVSKIYNQQYQKDPPNSITDDTRNNRTKSSNEISDKYSYLRRTFSNDRVENAIIAFKKHNIENPEIPQITAYLINQSKEEETPPNVNDSYSEPPILEGDI